MEKNNTRILKLANKYLVLQCITTYEPITVEDIVKKTNLSRPTVINSVKELTEENVVMKGGRAESTGGRTAVLLTTNADAYYAVGADFEFPQVRMAIANLKGTILASRQFDYPLEISAEEIIRDLPERIHSFIQESAVDTAKIEGVGLGIPGVVDVNSGSSKYIERISGWRNIDIKKALEDKLGFPVYIRNDVHLMGLVEKRFYMTGQDEDFIYIGLRSGIGSAIFIDNDIYEGNNGNAGFIGHMILDINGPKGFGGPKGCLNVFAGELSLIQKYRESKGLPENPLTGESRGIRLENLVQLAGEGDRVCADILEEAGKYIGTAIANMVEIFEIPKIVIGGCSNIEGSGLFQAVQNTAMEYLKYHIDNPVITAGRLLEEEYPLGGCYLVFDHIFHKPQLNLQI
ncbi:ROK family transcriptional regulator [Paenibacillus sp. S150]|uniref:ROK family transcriptional regulator n=1 Tax=Paenibacillus sp. S150 TaxID=2749826 RepID=UPI001C55C9D6|nr:ROK family transcriptional regulator [Paenibacillus sp. S150]MBW4079839.1 ROK family transcriptional regulator [Paenibacillus sp. S150]